MQRASLEERVARLGRAVARAANDEPSEARQAALEGLARFQGELASYFAEEEARAVSAEQRDARARLSADLAEIGSRARAAGDWRESWRSVATAFDRFKRALEQHARAED